MKEKILVAVDAMGGDYAPHAAVGGAILASRDEKLKILLVGREGEIRAALESHHYSGDSIEIIDAPDVIGTDEPPTIAIKQKKSSSLMVGLKLLKEKKADAFVSAGNTGALLAGSTIVVGRIKGIERPALATLLPNSKGFTFLIDSGANVDCKPQYLLQFAYMGHVYMENVMGIKNPKVGLINIGSEKDKGNILTKEAYELLENANLNFVGNVEARDIPSGAVDIAVCDAFVGNILLKYTEGLAKTILGMVKDELMASTITKIGAFIAQNAFKNLKKSFDYSEIGGAPFLGLNALVVKAHGSSNENAIKGAINQCVLFIENDIINKIEQNTI